tara:strand:- start:786 stop:1580 length:795 start_codon:yes stop_codon:yes gene_type:complete
MQTENHINVGKLNPYSEVPKVEVDSSQFLQPLFLELKAFKNWTLPEWLSVIGGIGTIFLLAKWSTKRIFAAIRSGITHSGRATRRFVRSSLKLELNSLLDSIEMSVQLEKHPHLCTIFIFRVLLKLLFTLIISAIVFIGAPQPVDIFLSCTLLIFSLLVIVFLVRELDLFMHAESRVKQFREKFIGLDMLYRGESEELERYFNETCEVLDRLLIVAKDLDAHRSFTAPASDDDIKSTEDAISPASLDGPFANKGRADLQKKSSE